MSAPGYRDDPVGYLTQIARRPPSHECLTRLAGSVAAGIKDAAPSVAGAYLAAAAVHLSVESSSATARSLAAVAAADATSSSVVLERQTTKEVFEIVEAVGHAVTRCHRSSIAPSGILTALARLGPAPRSRVESATSLYVPVLHHSQVELLQACIYAEHYHYAEQLVSGTWPRPSSTTSVRHVLRYYYLRGTVHIGCRHWTAAVRCFTTVLSVPSDMVSAVAVAAWKKRVLVQAILAVDEFATESTTASALTLRLPKAAPPCLTRFLKAALTPSPPASLHPAAAAPEDVEAMHMVESSENEGIGGRAPPPHPYASLGVKAYGDLIAAYERRDRTALQTLVQQDAILWQRDGNSGLVEDLLAALARRQVYYAARIYSTIGLDHLTQWMGVASAEVEAILRELSLQRAWPVEIQADMVVFPRFPTADQGDASTEELAQLAMMVQKLDFGVAASPKYIALSKKEASSHGAAAEARAGPRGVEDV